ncbi:MAG: hypothetical protein HYV28_13770 [Ignavibacteriales bacterium]|nr:hypothetical protein [Ignavibacteriales bacterium]
MITAPLFTWLLDGDIAIQYQTRRDLLNEQNPGLQERIAQEGWGAKLLSYRAADGHWGKGFYQSKWTSTHYVLLELKNMAIAPGTADITAYLNQLLKGLKGGDGGIDVSETVKKSDVCVSGMFLNYASYFLVDESGLASVVDYLLNVQMPDGGFNCQSTRKGATHSSLHSTLSVIEGIREYARNGYKYRLNELLQAERESREFILEHRLYKSHRTEAIINQRMLMLPFPPRWKYDILRALDYFREAGAAYDERMQDAVEVLLQKRKPDGKWPLHAKHPGKTYFDMEQAGSASRWNTLRALRVLKHFGIE